MHRQSCKLYTIVYLIQRCSYYCLDPIEISENPSQILGNSHFFLLNMGPFGFFTITFYIEDL